MLQRLTTKFDSDLVCLIWLCNILWYLFLLCCLAFLLFVLFCLRVCLRVLSFVDFLVRLCDISSEKRWEVKEDEKAPHYENSAILGQLKMADCEP